MKPIRTILCVILLGTSLTGFTQQSKAVRNLIRQGNKAYRDSSFVDADVFYKKAIDKDSKSAIALYNMGNSLLLQSKASDAMQNYQKAAQIESDKPALSEIFHNSGIINYLSGISNGQSDHGKAINALKLAIEDYKQSLRNNPTDHETRYNLVMAQKMLKDQQQQQNQQKDDKQQKQEQKKEEQEKQNKPEQQNQQQQQQSQMSKENAEQMLNAVMQDEKETQERLQKRMQVLQDTPLQKDW